MAILVARKINLRQLQVSRTGEISLLWTRIYWLTQNIFRRFQYFSSALLSPATWSVSCSFQSTGCSSLPAPMCGFSTSGTQVRGTAQKLPTQRHNKDFFITACHAVQVQSSISMSNWAKICHWAISHKWYNTITFIRHYWQYLLFREGNMSANSVPLAPLCLHRGCGQAEGIQVPFRHQEPSISSWPVQTLRSALVSTRSILRTTLPANVIPVSCVLELQTVHWFSQSC